MKTVLEKFNQTKNSSADISPTGQMPRLLGLHTASKIYRKVSGITKKSIFSRRNEVAWELGNA
jgi:hypothetical protein